MITLSENFRALFYAPFYAAHAIGAYAAEGVEVYPVHARIRKSLGEMTRKLSVTLAQ